MSLGGQQRVPSDGPPADGWSARTFVVGIAAVLAARLLYLARYGWDIGWMNLVYLGHARAIALGRAQAAEEQPLAFYALVAARRLGASARAANEFVYLVAHLLLAAGALGIARFIWPAASARRRAALCATLAVVPLLASQSGRNNLGVSLAAGLAASALALAATGATAARLRPRTVAALALAALAAALASTGRYEALVTCGGAALLLAFLGGRMPGVPGHRRAALALAAGAAGGLAAVIAIRSALAAGAQPDKTYAFYTFFDGLPLLMYPHLPGTEYGRYKASVGYFGGFRDNGGSLAHALLHHPGFAALRVVTKPIDLLAVLLWVYGLTPVGVALAALGLRGGARRPPGAWSRGWLLAAYLAPLAMLFIPQQNPAYYVSIAVPLVLAVARGADRLGARLTPPRARALGAATVLAALALIAGAGKLGVSNSRAINAAVPYLEERCRAGCLTSVLPQALRGQAWVVTDAGAPLPPPAHRNEEEVLRTVPPRRLAAYDFCGRVRRARAAGFAGPVLYVDARVRSFKVFDADFDPEVR
ncbi:MAG TPA: hypothetical protein VHO06_16615, partial [Polyangia bacterium]|nr:hypothetical protein [Polyangia bacterium]